MTQEMMGLYRRFFPLSAGVLCYCLLFPISCCAHESDSSGARINQNDSGDSNHIGCISFLTDADLDLIKGGYWCGTCQGGLSYGDFECDHTLYGQKPNQYALCTGGSICWAWYYLFSFCQGYEGEGESECNMEHYYIQGYEHNTAGSGNCQTMQWDYSPHQERRDVSSTCGVACFCLVQEFFCDFNNDCGDYPFVKYVYQEGNWLCDWPCE